MNNPINITTENLTYSITTELDDTAFSKEEMPFTLPFTMPGGLAGGVFNIATENLTYSINVEQVT
jgi:hypothetical protein